MKARKRWLAILLGLVFALNLALATYALALKRDNNKIQTAYLERTYEIYTLEIYPLLEGLDLESLHSSGITSRTQMAQVWGLNAVSTAGYIPELLYTSGVGGTSLNRFVEDGLNKLYYLLEPDRFKDDIFFQDRYGHLSEEALFQQIVESNRQVKLRIDRALADGKSYIKAFEEIEPYLMSVLQGGGA